MAALDTCQLPPPSAQEPAQSSCSSWAWWGVERSWQGPAGPAPEMEACLGIGLPAEASLGSQPRLLPALLAQAHEQQQRQPPPQLRQQQRQLLPMPQGWQPPSRRTGWQPGWEPPLSAVPAAHTSVVLRPAGPAAPSPLLPAEATEAMLPEPGLELTLRMEDLSEDQLMGFQSMEADEVEVSEGGRPAASSTNGLLRMAGAKAPGMHAGLAHTFTALPRLVPGGRLRMHAGLSRDLRAPPCKSAHMPCVHAGAS